MSNAEQPRTVTPVDTIVAAEALTYTPLGRVWTLHLDPGGGAPWFAYAYSLN